MAASLLADAFILAGLVAPFIWSECYEFSFGDQCPGDRFQFYGVFASWLLSVIVGVVSMFFNRFASIRLHLAGLLLATTAGLAGMFLFQFLLWNP